MAQAGTQVCLVIAIVLCVCVYVFEYVCVYACARACVYVCVYYLHVAQSVFIELLPVKTKGGAWCTQDTEQTDSVCAESK